MFISMRSEITTDMVLNMMELNKKLGTVASCGRGLEEYKCPVIPFKAPLFLSVFFFFL